MKNGDRARATGSSGSEPEGVAGPDGGSPAVPAGELQAAHELGQVQEVARQLVSSLDPESALEELVQAAAGIGSALGARPCLAVVLRAGLDAGQGHRAVAVAPARRVSAPFERALRRHVDYVTTSGRPVQFMLADVPAGPGRQQLAEARIGSVAMVPISMAGEAYGVLAVGSREGSMMGPSWLRRLTLLADLGGLAIANATAYQRERRALRTSQEHLRELTLLHDATRTFSATLALDRIEREVVRTAARLVATGGAPQRRAVFIRVDGGTATVAHEDDLTGLRHAGISFPISAHPVVHAALRRRRALAASVDDIHLGTADLRRRLTELAATHLAFAPVFVQDQPYGVVMVSVEDERGFSSEQLRRLEAIASLAELAIANGRHFDAVRREGERMAALEEVKSKFLRLASHELRSPLAVLRGYVSMLRDGTFGDRAERLQEVYAILEAKASQMELLVTQMLEAARLEEGRLRLDLRRIDLRQPVRDAFDGARLVAQPGHELSLEMPAEPVEVLADPGRITTIVANLLDNALKYSPYGGPVRCAVRVEPAGAAVEVADRGLGIAAADQPTLFTRFGRVETAENQHIQGTGLGLYLSRELAQMLHGTLSAASEAGAGSTFTLRVPLTPAG